MWQLEERLKPEVLDFLMAISLGWEDVTDNPEYKDYSFSEEWRNLSDGKHVFRKVDCTGWAGVKPDRKFVLIEYSKNGHSRYMPSENLKTAMESLNSIGENRSWAILYHGGSGNFDVTIWQGPATGIGRQINGQDKKLEKAICEAVIKYFADGFSKSNPGIIETGISTT